MDLREIFHSLRTVRRWREIVSEEEEVEGFKFRGRLTSIVRSSRGCCMLVSPCLIYGFTACCCLYLLNVVFRVSFGFWSNLCSSNRNLCSLASSPCIYIGIVVSQQSAPLSTRTCTQKTSSRTKRSEKRSFTFPDRSRSSAFFLHFGSEPDDFLWAVESRKLCRRIAKELRLDSESLPSSLLVQPLTLIPASHLSVVVPSLLYGIQYLLITLYEP